MFLRIIRAKSGAPWRPWYNPPIAVKLLLGINVGFLTSSSYVDPTGFPRGGKYFLFPQNKP